MGRIYTCEFSGQASAAQVDVFELVAPADAIVLIHQLVLTQALDVGDTEEEMLLIQVKSGQTTSGSGGSAGTAVPRELGDAAFGGTVEYMNSTKASTGTIVTHSSEYWNIRMPYEKIWTPELRPVLSPSRRATVELGTTPADSITFGGTIWFEELGG